MRYRRFFVLTCPAHLTFGMWRNGKDVAGWETRMKNPILKGNILGLALLCFAAFAGGVLSLMKQSNWHRSQGKITAITLECGMRAVQGDNVYTKDIPCELSDAFKQVNADKTWKVTEKYQSTVQFTGADNAMATTEITLYARDGNKPAVGDTFPVLQNPEDTSEVVRPDPGLTVMLMIGSGLLGGAIVFFQFRRKPGQPKRPEPMLEETSNDNERNARADAMIAASLARRETEARATPAASPLVVRAGTAQARGFGRKR
jgi:hypothetical protein